MNITINNYGTIHITDEVVKNAKNKLLNRMYYARYKDTLGGYQTWLELLDYYFMGNYAKMYSIIASCPKSSTRTLCLNYLKDIMG